MASKLTVTDLVKWVPEAQRPAAVQLVTSYGPKLFELAQEDAWQYIRRILAGDLQAVVELDAQLTDAAWIAKVKANTDRWSGVATYNKVRADIGQEFAMRTSTLFLSILLALVGL